MRKLNVKKLLLTGLLGTVVFSTNLMGADNKVLTEKQKSLIPIGVFTATGDLENLKESLNDGLDSKLTVNEIKEVLVHSYAYAGFPRSLNGINTFISVLSEREKQGIKDEIGKEASPVDKNIDKNQYGEKIRTSLTGVRPTPAYAKFAPVIDDFLKEHLFADIFMRDNLDYLSRELTTISILAGLGNVNGQLAGHMNVCMNIGMTPEQMNEFIAVLREKAGDETADNAQKVAEQVLKNRTK